MIRLDLKPLQRWLNPKRLVLFQACAIGLVAALSAVILKQSIGLFGGWRIQIANDLPPLLALPLIGLCGGYLSGFLIETFAPEAAGSGIPQVKAALGYVPVVINLRVAIVKLISTILALGSGLALGRQGPTVQIGAALAAQLSRWVPTSPDYQRQLIAVGAAAGLAAGFNAPISGVLFVIEELLHDVSSLTLSTAILASFIGGVVSRILGGSNLPTLGSQLSAQVQFDPIEIPFFILLGALIGVFAVLFSRGVIAGIGWNRRIFKLRLRWRIAIAGVVSGVAIALLPMDFRDSTGLQQFLSTGSTQWQLTAGAFAVRFCLTLIACSAEAPGGLFAPTLILGAALGSLFGNWEVSLLHSGNPSVYALAGMGAFFGAVAKVPITAFVIVFEMTMDFNIVLPLMIVTVVANLVSEKFIPGSLYTQLLAMNGISLKAEPTADGIWLSLKAGDIMQQKVETLNVDMGLDEVRLLFGRSHHRGFPVLEAGKVVGIVTQTDLVKIQERKRQGIETLREVMTPNPVTVSPEDSLAQVLYLLSHFKLSRLPVIDSSRLVGIITRSDILRVETDKLKGADYKPLDRSYAIYQTRGASTGRGLILLPLRNTWEENVYLIDIGLAIASSLTYELECLSIITISQHLSTAKTSVSTTNSIDILDQAKKLADANKVPLHTQIRVSHEPATTIQEVIDERFIDLVLLDWQQGYIPATCNLVMIRKANAEYMPTFGNRWLVVISDVNAEAAIAFIPHLIPANIQPQISVCHIFHANQKNYEPVDLNRSVQNLARNLQIPIEIIPICTKSIADAMSDISQQEQSDVVIYIGKPNQLEKVAEAIACNLIFMQIA